MRTVVALIIVIITQSDRDVFVGLLTQTKTKDSSTFALSVFKGAFRELISLLMI